jgi:hypothetical protein
MKREIHNVDAAELFLYVASGIIGPVHDQGDFCDESLVRQSFDPSSLLRPLLQASARRSCKSSRDIVDLSGLFNNTDLGTSSTADWRHRHL